MAVRLLGRKPVAVFLDDEGGYLEWLPRHPDGFVTNAARRPRADYLILHRASCHTISGTPARGSRWTTGDFTRVSSWSAEDNRQGVLAVELAHPGSTTASANPSTVQLNWSFA